VSEPPHFSNKPTKASTSFLVLKSGFVFLKSTFENFIYVSNYLFILDHFDVLVLKINK